MIPALNVHETGERARLVVGQVSLMRWLCVVIVRKLCRLDLWVAMRARRMTPLWKGLCRGSPRPDPSRQKVIQSL
jgi:hypothetical protein